MTVIHIHRVPTRVHSQHDHGVHWCFRCRKRIPFTRTVHTPTDPMSYYGPHVTVECERGHDNGDLFPGWIREWSE